MKTLSLWQPWASLMADGRKKIETRHWPAPQWLIGKPLAIHATMRVDRGCCASFRYDVETIPRGCVVAIVRVEKCECFTEGFARDILRYPEGNYGDFTPGRYGWFCRLIQKLEPPVAAVGRQGIWEWDLEGYAGVDI